MIIRQLLRVAAMVACASPLALAIAEGGQAAPPAASSPTATQRQVAGAFAEVLEANYLFPDVAGRYAEAVRRNAAAGAYDGLEPQALADRLTRDVKLIFPDAHLRVNFLDPDAAAGAESGPDGPGPLPEMIHSACRLGGDIAYIRFNVFPSEPASVAAVRRFLEDHVSARTLIIDLRRHFGGGLAEIDAMLPYFYASTAVLAALDTRIAADEAGLGFEDGPTLRQADPPAGIVRREHFVTPMASEARLRDAEIFVLTSRHTISAAEHLAFALKRTGRATLIGEPTRGAGHYGDSITLVGGFEAFVPVGRTFDPTTGWGWEGSGVAPDIEVGANAALEEALVRSGMSRQDGQRISEMPCQG